MSKRPRDWVTIVSGFPRSGTSLMMQVLYAAGMPLLSDGLRVPDAYNPNGYFEYDPVKRTRRDASWVREAQGRAVKVILQLLAALPARLDNRALRYRVVLVRRDLGEVVASQERMLRGQGKPEGGLSASRLCEVLEAQWTQTRVWLAAQPHFSALEVDTWELLESPESVLAQLADFLDLDASVEKMATVIDTELFYARPGEGG